MSSGLGLIETLQILESFSPRPGARYAADADFLHYAIEAWKVRDQSGRIADPALFDVDLGSHLDPAHAAKLFERIDPKKASRYGGETPARTEAPERIGRGTTAFAVADSDGNMIAVTQTLSTWGGTFYVSEGLGFLYNNPFAPRWEANAPRALSGAWPAPSKKKRCPTLHLSRKGGLGP